MFRKILCNLTATLKRWSSVATVAWNVSDVEDGQGAEKDGVGYMKAGRRYRSAPRRQLGVYIGASRLLGYVTAVIASEWIISIVTGPTVRSVVVNNCSGTKCKAATVSSLNAGHVDAVDFHGVGERIRYVSPAIQGPYACFTIARVIEFASLPRESRDPRQHVSSWSPSIGCTFGCGTFTISDHPKPL